MRETATFRTRTAKGFPRWPTTRYAAARPNTWPALHSAPPASPPPRKFSAADATAVARITAARRDDAIAVDKGFPNDPSGFFWRSRSERIGCCAALSAGELCR